jgi:hypothetical protein
MATGPIETPDDSQFAEAPVTQLDLQELRDLLDLLLEKKVQVFSMGGLSVSFKQEEPQVGYSIKSYKDKQLDEEDSDHLVKGFTTSEGGFRDSRLWKDQGGKPISFEG